MVKLKYVILDEISLELVIDKNADTMIFNSKEKATEYAKEYIQGWQIIEIPFEED